MCEIVRLSRACNDKPWGFRLVGGSDMNSPLTIVKVTGGSIAEQCGLQVGDIINEINGNKVVNYTHTDAQKRIYAAGNDLSFAVLRGGPIHPPPLTPIRGMTPVAFTERSHRTISTTSIESFDSAYDVSTFEIIESNNFEDVPEKQQEPTEEKIAEMLLENAELIEEKGKQVIGVNFKRFIPKCEFIKDSAVFQVLQEEQVHKELSEREQLAKCPNKRFSTFLAPPDWPVPKPKPKVKEQPLQCTLRPHETVPETEPNNHESNPETGDHTSVEKEESAREEINEQCTTDQNAVNRSSSTDDVVAEIDKRAAIDSPSIAEESISLSQENDHVYDEKETKEEESCEGNKDINGSDRCPFDQQLAIIKSKLDNLQQLPSLIESQLSEVQKQISDLISLKTATKSNSVFDESQETNASTEQKTDDDVHDATSRTSEEGIIEEETISAVSKEEHEAECNDNYDVISNEEISELCSKQCKQQLDAEREESVVSYEMEDVRQNARCSSSVADRPVCPLTPLPRPLVLPGGRRWRKPKDAYNEQFIAETLISQAEVLVGSTLGVNFRKYESPKVDLSNSAVYKMVHDIESKNKGIANRPEIVPAEQDYYQSPISSRHFYCAQLACKSNETISD